MAKPLKILGVNKSIKFDEVTVKRVEAIAEFKNISFSDVVRNYIADGLDREELVIIRDGRSRLPRPDTHGTEVPGS